MRERFFLDRGLGFRVIMRERFFLDRGLRFRGHHEGALLPRQRFRVSGSS